LGHFLCSLFFERYHKGRVFHFIFFCHLLKQKKDAISTANAKYL
jgi:hypothetical protein